MGLLAVCQMTASLCAGSPRYTTSRNEYGNGGAQSLACTTIDNAGYPISTSSFWLVSELVTNAVRFVGNPTRTLRYSERANAGLISLSIRHFREGLLIEVYDTDSNPPIRYHADEHAESGRGLMLVEALSKEWSYFFPPGGGKVVYCYLEIP